MLHIIYIKHIIHNKIKIEEHNNVKKKLHRNVRKGT